MFDRASWNPRAVDAAVSRVDLIEDNFSLMLAFSSQLRSISSLITAW